MLKKLIPLMISVAALLALAAPAAHATGPLITNAEGEAVTEINAESTNTTWSSANGAIECATTKFSGTITTNASTTAHGGGTGTAEGTAGLSHTGHCGAGGSAQIDVTGIGLNALHLAEHSGETTGTMTLTITYQLTTIFGTGHCTFEGSEVAVNRTGADTINVNGRLVLPGGSLLCLGEVVFNGDFTVRDQNGEPVVIH